jgi:hypothetical protein
VLRLTECVSEGCWVRTKTVSYVVRRPLTQYGGNMELDCAGWTVGDCEAADPAVKGAAAGRRNVGHA